MYAWIPDSRVLHISRDEYGKNHLKAETTADLIIVYEKDLSATIVKNRYFASSITQKLEEKSILIDPHF